MKKTTLKILWVLIEIAATVRAGIATWTVVMDVAHGDMVFSAFTTATVEIAFLVALLSIGSDASAPISAFVALMFSAAMQYIETLVLDGGALTPQDKNILRSVIAFAPIAILGLTFIRRVAESTDVSQVAESIGSVLGPRKSVTQTADADADATPKRSSATSAGRVRTCSECGEQFHTTNAKRVTCSAACRVARSRRLAK